jgi:hypothetical protein
MTLKQDQNPTVHDALFAQIVMAGFKKSVKTRRENDTEL